MVQTASQTTFSPRFLSDQAKAGRIPAGVCGFDAREAGGGGRALKSIGKAMGTRMDPGWL